MDILQQKLIGYPSRVNYTKIIENCKTRQRDYFKTRTFYTYTYIYFLFWQIFTRKAEERNNFSRPIHDSMCSSLFPNAYPVHMCATLLAPKFIANPSPLLPAPPPRFPPHPFHHDHRCLHLHHRSSYTARSIGLPHDPSHTAVSPTLRARVSLAPFNHATPPSSPSAALFTSQSCWNNTCAR